MYIRSVAGFTEVVATAVVTTGVTEGMRSGAVLLRTVFSTFAELVAETCLSNFFLFRIFFFVEVLDFDFLFRFFTFSFETLFRGRFWRALEPAPSFIFRLFFFFFFFFFSPGTVDISTCSSLNF